MDTFPESPLSDAEIDLLRRVFYNNREILLNTGKAITQDIKL